MAEETKKGKYVSKEPIWLRILRIVLQIIVIIICAVAGYVKLTDKNKICCEKATIQNQLKTVIKNGGDLDAVKDAYNDRDLKNISFIFSRLETKDYYKEVMYFSEGGGVGETPRRLLIGFFEEILSGLFVGFVFVIEIRCCLVVEI